MDNPAAPIPTAAVAAAAPTAMIAELTSLASFFYLVTPLLGSSFGFAHALNKSTYFGNQVNC